MRFLPEIKTMSVAKSNSKVVYIKLNEDDSMIFCYKLKESSDVDILKDLIEARAFATTMLYLNEEFTPVFSRIAKEDVKSYYEDCKELLESNIEVVEEVAPLLLEIGGYPIYEANGYILRGKGKKKIKESFDFEISDELKEAIKQYIIHSFSDEAKHFGFGYREPYTNDPAMYSVYQSVEGNTLIPSQKMLSAMGKYYSEIFDDVVKENDLKEDGMQATDVASKIDQGDKVDSSKKKRKHYDILLSKIDDLDEGVCLKGFYKNDKGQYQRGNYILVKENNKYIAMNKNKLSEADVSPILRNLLNIQNKIKQDTGASVTIENDGNIVSFIITGNSEQLMKTMEYGDTLSKMFKELGNKVELSITNNSFIYKIIPKTEG